MGLSQFSISVEANGRGRVEIDGVDYASLVRRVSVDCASGGVPKVFLEMLGEGRIEGEGIVTQVIDLDPRQVVSEFLENLDAASLETVALEKMGGLGGSVKTGQAFISALQDMVRGNDDGS